MEKKYRKTVYKRYSTTPEEGTVTAYINGEVAYQKHHISRKMREAYCNKIFYDHQDKEVKFVFQNEDIELVMKDYHPERDTIVLVKKSEELPTFKKDGEVYFDADEFCKTYDLGNAIPSKLQLHPLRF